MTTREQWLALAERCETAVDDDRDLGLAILDAAGWRFKVGENGDWGWHDAEGGYVAAFFSPAASLDAITALIDREGWKRWHLDFCGGSVVPAVARVVDSKATGAHSATPALALCAAFCLAKAERAGE